MGTRAGIGADCTARCNDVGKVPVSETDIEPREAALVFFRFVHYPISFSYVFNHWPLRTRAHTNCMHVSIEER